MPFHKLTSDAITIATKRVTTGSIPGTGSGSVTVTWDEPFPDTNYTPVASVLENDQGESLRVRRIETKTASAIVVNVVNNALGSTTGEIQAMAIAD